MVQLARSASLEEVEREFGWLRFEPYLTILDLSDMARSLVGPDHFTILLLPPYAYEPNPIGNLRHWIENHHTNNQAYAGDDGIMDAATDAGRSQT